MTGHRSCATFRLRCTVLLLKSRASRRTFVACRAFAAKRSEYPELLSSAFVDTGKFLAAAGNGGDGCVSFLREKYLPKGPPNGGSGGPGGNIYLMAVEGATEIGVPMRVRASPGSNGKGSGMNGRKGDDHIVSVPLGTVVTELPVPDNFQVPAEVRNKWVHYPRTDDNSSVDQRKEAEKILRKQRLRATHHSMAALSLPRAILDFGDRSYLNKPVLLCHGGTGGFGNPIFATSTDRNPRFASRGLPGEVRYFQLDLKTLSDVGLVGLPNAGKSTFLRAVSNARPRVADWAFTTLTPYLGTVAVANSSFTIADIPGIIGGASLNKGLGHSFLRHIERASVLAFVVDLSQSPIDDYKILRQELKAYKPGLELRRHIVLANKADLQGSQIKLATLTQAIAEIWSGLNDSNRGDDTRQLPVVLPLNSKDKLGITNAIRLLNEIVIGEKNKVEP